MASKTVSDEATATESVKPARHTHPTYLVMVKEAIKQLAEKNGSSRQKITKYIINQYFVSPDMNKVNHHVTSVLKKGVTDGILLQTKGKGASGSFKLAKKEKDSVPKKKKTAEEPKVRKAKQSVNKLRKASVPKTPKSSSIKSRVNRRLSLQPTAAISAAMTPARKPTAKRTKAVLDSTVTLSPQAKSSSSKPAKKPAAEKKASKSEPSDKKTKAEKKVKTSRKKAEEAVLMDTTYDINKESEKKTTKGRKPAKEAKTPDEIKKATSKPGAKKTRPVD